MTPTDAAAPPPAPTIDERLLQARVDAERMRQYMSRERGTGASGVLPSAYVAWLMVGGGVDSASVLSWWLALLAIDLCTVLHTSLYLRTRRENAQARWLWRQVAMQTAAGLVWGCALPLAGQSPDPRLAGDVGLVLMTVNAIAVIGLLHYRRAVLSWTLAVWAVPLAFFTLDPTPRHLQFALGVGVLMASLNFYLWRASGQLVDGLEKRLRADALAAALQQAMERIRELATRDELTGVFNRRHGMEMLRTWVPPRRRPRENAGPPALLLLDIDHFKAVNDQHGHPVGDAVLREVGRRLQDTLRASDVLSRIGGEEFMVALPGATWGEALGLAERLRAAIAATPIGHGALQLPVSVSLGVALLTPGESLEQLLARADAALYRAKHGGRNRVEAAEPPPLPLSALAG
jgi:diguanylate cyclase (GGDEF)-like protein